MYIVKVNDSIVAYGLSSELEAYSANCLMLPFVKENPVLNEIASNHR